MFVDGHERELLREVVNRCLQDYRNAFQGFVSLVTANESPFAPRLQLPLPNDVQTHCEELGALFHTLANLPPEGGEVPERYGPCLRDAVVAERLAIARRVETHRQRAVHPELLGKVDAQLAPYDNVLRRDWFRQADKAHVPHLRDYFPLELLEAEEPRNEVRRVLDEKFHILQAPSLFLPDLEGSRRAGGLRRISCAVVYLDVDDFKQVNREFGEPFVDRNILPVLMRALEGHVYGRGRAYRFGGDEYILLLENTTVEEADDFLERLRSKVERLSFLGTRVDFKLTVSIGFVIVAPDCHLTDKEIESKAAAAKQAAKQSGKNRMASFEDSWFEVARVISPPSSEN